MSWHNIAADELQAEEQGEALSMDDALTDAGVDPYTSVDRLPLRGSIALAAYLGGFNECDE